MNLPRLLLLTLTALTATLSATPVPEPILLWDGVAPGSEVESLPWETYGEEWITNKEDGRQLVRWVTQPSIQLFVPETESDEPWPVILIAPGGGYNIIEIEREGFDVARRLNQSGIAVAVLKYRHYTPEIARRDAHRALRMLRARATEWNLDASKVGMGGFSAGGHLSARVAFQPDLPTEWAADAFGSESPRPDFALLVYGECPIPANMPLPKVDLPTFIVGSCADNPDSRIHFFERLLYAGIPAELHLFQSGEHGFAVDQATQGGREWPGLFESWLEVNAILAK